jgi:aminopeptidase N
MIDFYSRRLGVPYAWPKYSQIAVRDYVSGAMENTSATLHGDFMVYQTDREMADDKKGEYVVAHELFHQWFGDLVTCESWSNLPLNESFATYGEYLWDEYKNGRDAADYHHWQSRQGYLGSQKEVELIRYHYKDKEDMFDRFSYNKGGQVLHMLRKAVGDDAFFASLKNYLETNKFKSAEIHHLRLAFEETTGRDMNWFFNQWFLSKGRPKLKVTKSYDASKGAVELTVEQNQDLQNTPLYTLPLEIDVYVNGKAQRTHITITEQKQSFSIPANAAPQLLNFDAERQLLCDLDYGKTTEEYLFQYHNAPLFDDRYEALKELEKQIADPQVYALFKEAALNDKFYAIRNFAISKLEKAPEDKLQETKACLLAVYKNDARNKTRARALGSLNAKFKDDPEIKTLNEQALNASSYAICSEALDAISKSDPKLALEKAKLFWNESGKDILFSVANVYATYGADEELPFFRKALKYINGFEILSFSSAYVKTARRCANSSSAIAAAMDLETLSKGANKFIKFGLVKGIKDLTSNWESRETGLKAKLEADKKDNKNISDLEKELKTATETKEILQKMYNRSR